MKIKRTVFLFLFFIPLTVGCARKAGPLSGEYRAVALLGEGKFTSPVISARGGFKDYLPLPELPANTCKILQLQKK